MIMSLSFEHHPLLLSIEWFSKIFGLELWGVAILSWHPNGQNFINSLNLSACRIPVMRLVATVNKVAMDATYLYDTTNYRYNVPFVV